MDFFIILIIFFTVTANLIGFLIFKKSRNLYLAALSILILAGVFGAMEGFWAVAVIEDGFAFFYGFHLATILLYNSIIIILIAILGWIIKKIKKHW